MRRILSQLVIEAYGTTPLSSRASRLEEIAPEASAAERVQLGLLPMVLPDLVRALEQLMVTYDPGAPSRAFASGLLTYVYNPLDIMPDEDVLGFIDDALICARGLLQLQSEHGVVLESGLVGMCQWALALEGKLDPGLQRRLDAFMENLLQSIHQPPDVGLPPESRPGIPL